MTNKMNAHGLLPNEDRTANTTEGVREEKKLFVKPALKLQASLPEITFGSNIFGD